ncbi:MAG: hypothetical protein M0017_09000 [Desulfobacteraceae bacterium]|nr:hypothetical protein [Desulfobacteraceae bacterium]
MHIDCYLAPGCGSEQGLRESIQAALRGEGVEAEVRFHRIEAGEAERLGLRGSPSVLIDGEDIQPAAVAGFA